MLIGTSIAWWLARAKSVRKGPVGALVALSIVLPPTVLGFYPLVLMGPNGPVGQFTQWAGLGLLPFTFWGLVVASVFYSMPFVVQPIRNAFEAMDDHPMEVAATLCAAPLDAFFGVALPLARPGFLAAAMVAFASLVCSRSTPSTRPGGAQRRGRPRPFDQICELLGVQRLLDRCPGPRCSVCVQIKAVALIG